MTMQTDDPGPALVPGAHRTIRALGVDEGPFTGVLVTAGDGVAVRSDAEALSGWVGWAHAGHEHVAGPLDLVRRHGGHDVLLPWCTESVDVFLGRRAAAGAPLTAGEVSTLAVSMLRGVAEMGGEHDRGRWWLTDGGRPLFVIGDGVDVREESAALLARLRLDIEDRMLGRVLDAVCDGLVEGLGRPRMLTAQLERWEADLLAIAAPRMLETSLHAPERVRAIAALRDAAPSRVPSSRRA
ncbi:MAG: hypothetical protein QM568_08885, partial [Microbacterium sp.]